MTQIIALKCPVCGAPLREDAEECTYCGSVIFIKPNAPKLNRINLNKSVVYEHIEQFRRRVRTNNFDEEAHYGLGVAYYNLGLMDAAAEELTTASRLMPESVEIRTQLAVVLLEAGSTESDHAALRQLEAVLSLDSNNAEALESITKTLLRFGRYEEAERYAKRISANSANRSKYLQRIAESYLDQNRWNNAEQLLLSLNQSQAQSTLRDFLRKPNTPTRLVPLDYSTNDQEVGCLALSAVVVGILAYAAISDGEGGTSLFLIVVLAALIASIVKSRNSADEQVIEINPLTSNLGELKNSAQAVVRYRQGQLTTPEEVAEREKAAKATK